MKDFLLKSGDLTIHNGDFLLCKDNMQGLSQAIEIRLRTFLGEWFLDQNLGIPYLTQILGKKRSEAFLRRTICSGLRDISDLKEIKNIQFQQEENRSLQISLEAVFVNSEKLKINHKIEG